MVTEAEHFGRFGRPLRNADLLTSRGLIAGNWRSAPGYKTFPVYEPASGTVLLECSDFGRDDIVEAIHSAEVGQKKYYSSTTAKQRGQLLKSWNDLILKNQEDRKIVLPWVYHTRCRVRSR